MAALCTGRGPTCSMTCSTARPLQVDRLRHTNVFAAARTASSERLERDGVDRTHAEREVEEIEQRRGGGDENGSKSVDARIVSFVPLSEELSMRWMEAYVFVHIRRAGGTAVLTFPSSVLV